MTLAFTFYPGLHGYRALDVDNFIKPVLDGVAAGLFSPEEQDPQAIQHFNFDDSNFNTLLIQRLSDAAHPQGEGVAIFISSGP